MANSHWNVPRPNFESELKSLKIRKFTEFKFLDITKNHHQKPSPSKPSIPIQAADRWRPAGRCTRLRREAEGHRPTTRVDQQCRVRPRAGAIDVVILEKRTQKSDPNTVDSI